MSERGKAGSPVALVEQANGVVTEIIANIRPDQMELPTVNDDWTVRDLINHLVRGNVWSVQNLATGGAPRPTEDLIGDQAPLDAFTTTAAEMLAAYKQPGALDVVVKMPFGEMPGAGLAMFRFSDLISHAWDLARATGQDTNIAPQLSEAALAMAKARLESMDRAQTPFKAEVPVPADASAADRLAGYLGKPV